MTFFYYLLIFILFMSSKMWPFINSKLSYISFKLPKNFKNTSKINEYSTIFR